MSANLSAYDGQVHDPEGVYPLNWNSADKQPSKINVSSASPNNESGNIYPDFKVWYQTEEEENIMKSHLQKGYMEPQFVKHEDQSGRQLITELLNRSNNQTQSQLTHQDRDNKLDLMGQVFVDAMHKRRIFNGIKSKGAYKPPPRVTLTEHKKETWLKKLSNPSIPLHELSRAIPHGLRNKILLEQCLNHKIPISRAVWLIKCISTNEQRQLKRKTTNVSAMNINANKWIVEWSEQITLFFENIIENCFNSILPKEVWKYRLNYTIELVVNLYSEELMNQITFLTWIVRYLSRIVNNAHIFIDLKPLLIHHMIVKLFWFKIIRFDYLTKELSETMLLALVKTSQLPRQNKFDLSAQRISGILQYLIKYLFYYNSDIFILPSNWNYLKPYLKKVLDLHLAPVSEQFKLIAYRNESLTIDEFDRSSNSTRNSQSIPNDKFSFVLNKLNNTGNETIASLSKAMFEDPSTSDSSNWKSYIHLILQWCIQSVMEKDVINQRITLVCSILQYRQFQLVQAKSKRFKQFKADLENKILDFVYAMSEVLNYENKSNSKGYFYDINGFLVLISRLYKIKLFIVSSYLRRLIASGVIYLSDPDRTCYIHILILNLLPSSNDSNLKSILKRLTDSTKARIDKQDMNILKGLKDDFLNFLFKGKDIDADNFLNQYKCNVIFSYGDPTQIGQHTELSEYFYEEFDNKIKNLETKFQLTSNKLIIFYESFEIHTSALARFLVLMTDSLNQEDSKFVVDNDETLVLFLKMIFTNMKLLQYSIFNLKSSLWDHCLSVLKSWIELNKYNMIENLHNTNLTRSFLSLFGKQALYIESIKVDTKFLTPDELLSMELASYERLSNAAEFVHYMTLAITRYSNSIREGDDCVNIELIVKFLKTLQNWKTDEFTKCISDYLIRYLKPTLQLEYESNVKLLLKLIVDEFVSLKTIVEIFQNKTSANYFFETNNDNIHLLWDVFFNPRYELKFIDRFLYEYSRFAYITDNPNDYYKILTQIIYSTFQQSSDNKPISNVLDNSDTTVGVDNVGSGVGVAVDVNVSHSVDVDVMDTFHELNNNSSNDEFHLDKEKILNGKVIDSFWELVSSHRHLYEEYFYIPFDDFNHIDFSNLRKFVFNKFLRIQSSDDVNEMQVVEHLSYFNLPVLQWVFSYLIRERYKDYMNFNDNSSNFVLLVENILIIVERDSINHKLIGELFTFLSDNLKHQILFACEEIYLNSDNFPTLLIDGANVTNSLNYILSSCSRSKTGFSTKNSSNTTSLELSDGLVFSLNSALEKLINICYSLDHNHRKRLASRTSTSKNLELGIKMISKIILLHKYFLVELILKRSVNLQRDVLILNLMKLFNHKVMIKNPKLKNLLYDVLISIKSIISESITEQFQRNQGSISANSNQNTNIHVTNMPSPGVWIGKGTTPTGSTFFSSIDSPKPIPLSISGSHRTITSASPLSSNNNDANGENEDVTGGKIDLSNNSNRNSININNSGIINNSLSLTGSNGGNAIGKSHAGEDMQKTISSSGLNNDSIYIGGVLKTKSKLSTSKTGGLNKNINSANNNMGTGTNTYIVMPNILNIKPPSFNNNLKNLLSMFDLKDTIPEKTSKYYTVNQNWDGSVNNDETMAKYISKPFELIEDSCPRYAMDDTSIALQMFGVSAKRENPP